MPSSTILASRRLEGGGGRHSERESRDPGDRAREPTPKIQGLRVAPFRNGALAMQMPQPWPFSGITELRAWRDYLEHAQLANAATLRREADAEIARALRCQE